MQRPQWTLKLKFSDRLEKVGLLFPVLHSRTMNLSLCWVNLPYLSCEQSILSHPTDIELDRVTCLGWEKSNENDATRGLFAWLPLSVIYPEKSMSQVAAIPLALAPERDTWVNLSPAHSLRKSCLSWTEDWSAGKNKLVLKPLGTGRCLLHRISVATVN